MLDDKQIEARTNATLKMAQVSRQSVEEVSDQMTSIWNNFYDGSRSLEYYSDVITALGAATASSSEEIATGLEKFASIGEMIGLSYEYATASLATITATTRQSAEIVGTSLKTIFARIQGLKLGETLEDGVSLNKYSEALKAVGISIFDSKGELKEMDAILDEMGSKWGSLAKAEQTALAQTVAGVRQYNQLVALMENWDFMKENLKTIEASEGTLERQHKTYAEGWEAARDRVRNAAEDIYETLVNDDSFITLLDGLTHILNLIDNITESVGGLGGVLTGSFALFSKFFGDRMAVGLERTVQNIGLLLGTEQKKTRAFQAQATETLKKTASQETFGPEAAKLKMFATQAELQNVINRNSAQYSRQQAEIVSTEMEKLNLLQQQNLALNEQAAKAANIQELARNRLYEETYDPDDLFEKGKKSDQVDAFVDKIKGYSSKFSTNADKNFFNSLGINDFTVEKNKKGAVIDSTKTFHGIQDTTINAAEKYYQTLEKIKGIQQQVGKTEFKALSPEVKKSIEDLAKSMGITIKQGTQLSTVYKNMLNQLDPRKVSQFTKQFQKMFMEFGVGEKEAKAMTDALRQSATATNQANASNKEYSRTVQELLTKLQAGAVGVKAWSDVIVKAAQGVSAFAFSLMSLNNLMTVWDNEELSFGDKLLQTIISLSMVAPGFISLYKGVKDVIDGATAARAANAGATAADTVAQGANTAARAKNTKTIFEQTKQIILQKIALGQIQLPFRNFQNQVIALPGQVQQAGGAMNFAGQAFRRFGSGVAGAAMKVKNFLGPAGLATLAISAIAVGALAYSNHQKKVAEELEENANKALEQAKKLKSASEENEKLLSSMEDALEKYKKTGEGKDELDSITRQLASAYQVEGAAIAALTGQYQDYEKVLDAVNKKRIDTLDDDIASYQARLGIIQGQVENAAKAAGSNIVEQYGGGEYRPDIKADDEYLEILRQNGVETTDKGNVKLTGYEGVEDLINLYDRLSAARDEAYRAMGDAAASDKGVIATTKWLDRMAESIERAREVQDLLASSSALRAGLEGAEGVDSLEEYAAWAEQVKEILRGVYGDDEEKVESVFNDLIDASFGNTIQGLRDLSDAAEEAREKIKGTELESDAEGIFSGEKRYKKNEDGKWSLEEVGEGERGYDAAILAVMDWENVTVDSFEAAYAAAKRYYDFIKQNSKMEARRDSAEEGLKVLEDGVQRGDYDLLSSTIKWGEDGIIEFSKFLKMAYDEQVAYIQQLADTAQESSIFSAEQAYEGAKNKYEVAKQNHEEEYYETGKDENGQETLVLKNGFSDAATLIDQWNNLIAIVEKYRNLLQTEGSGAAGEYLGKLGDSEAALFKAIFGTDNLEGTKDKIRELGRMSAEEFEAGKQDYSLAGGDKAGELQNADRFQASEAAVKSAETDMITAEQNMLIAQTEDFYAKLSEYDIDTAEFEEYVKLLKKTNEGLTDAEAKIAALSDMRITKGIEEMSKSWEDWCKILKDTNSSIDDQAKVLAKMRKPLQNILDLEDSEFELLSDDFVSDNLGLINDVVNGVEGALQKLQIAAANDILIGVGLSGDKLQEAQNELVSAIAEMETEDIEIGATLDTSEAMSGLAELLVNSGLTANQIMGIFSTIGWDPSISTKEMTLKDAQDYYGNTSQEILAPAGIDENGVMQYKITTIHAAQKAGMDSDTTIQIPVINGTDKATTFLDSFKKNTTFKGGGKYRSPSRPKTGGRGGGGGGGGGGGSKKAEKKDPVETDLRYRKIGRSIDAVTRSLGRLDIQAERTFGTDKIPLLKQGFEELNKQAELYTRRLEEANGYLVEDLAAIKELGLNPIMDSVTDEITNYDELVKSIDAVYNAEIDKYNKMSAAQQEQYKERLDELEKEHDKQIEALEQYIETLDERNDTIEKIEEARRKAWDKSLEIAKAELEITLKIRDLRKNIRDINRQIAEAAGDYLDHGSKVLALEEERYNEALALQGVLDSTLNNLHSIAGDPYADTEALADALIKLSDEAISSAEDMLEFLEVIKEHLPNAVEAARERLDYFFETFDHNESILETTKELMALQGASYKTADGLAKLQKAATAQMNTQRAAMTTNKQWYDSLVPRVAEAEAELAKYEEGTAGYDVAKGARDALLAEMREAETAMLDSAQRAMEIAREMYETQVDALLYSLEQKLTNGAGFELLQSKYDHLIAANDRYLDEVNKIYQIEDLNRKIQADIDKSQGQYSISKLKGLQDELALMNKRNDVSAYELEIMNAKYAMLQAQIALEEAQNAKSEVRLMRDNNGNWNYQFTANQDDINTAQANYDKAVNDYYNIAKDYAKSTSADILSIQQEMMDELREIWTNEELTEQERRARMLEVQEYYFDQAKYLYDEQSKAVRDTGEAGKLVIEDFENQFTLSLEDMMGSFNDFESNTQKAIKDMEAAFEDYQRTIKAVANEAGVDLGNLTQKINEVEAATRKADRAADEMVEKLGQRLAAIQEETNYWAALADEIRDAAQARADWAGAVAGEVENMNDNYIDADYQALMNTYLANGGSETDAAYQKLVTQRNAKIRDLAAQGADPSFWQTNDGRTYSEEEYLKLMKAAGIPGFATGGFTGAWGDYGKLAFLHEKELVLNKKDTENILNAVNLVRDIGPALFQSIAQTLDKEAAASQFLMGARLNAPSAAAANEKLVQQVVSIDATFPGVQSANEIEIALTNLVNEAAQKAATYFE